MKITTIGTRVAGSSRMFAGNHGPTILTVTGVGGFIATTALAIRATLKAEKELPYLRAEIDAVKKKAVEDELNDKEKSRALAHVYGRDSLILARIYGPTIITGSASIVCVLSAHRILIKRNASLVAAYTALDAAYRAYRNRVRDEIGEEKELELYRRIKTKRPEGFDPNKECDEGLPCEIDRDDVLPSPYAKFFDEYSPNWTKTPEYNLMFLRSQQDWANDRLHAYGFIFLNEVYEALGLPRTQAGQAVGWKRKGNGDGFVDFGLYRLADESGRAFVNGVEPSILLDFNVDGPIRI